MPRSKNTVAVIVFPGSLSISKFPALQVSVVSYFLTLHNCTQSRLIPVVKTVFRSSGAQGRYGRRYWDFYTLKTIFNLSKLHVVNPLQLRKDKQHEVVLVIDAILHRALVNNVCTRQEVSVPDPVLTGAGLRGTATNIGTRPLCLVDLELCSC